MRLWDPRTQHVSTQALAAVLPLGLLALMGVASAEVAGIVRVSTGLGGQQANAASGAAEDRPVAVSGDGRFVAFASHANNLVPNDTNERQDIFLYDRTNGKVERASLKNDDGQSASQSGPAAGDFRSGDRIAISRDGRFVSFQSSGSDLTPNDSNGRLDVFVRDRQLGVTELVSLSDSDAQFNGDSFSPSLSDDGRIVGFTVTIGAQSLALVRNRQTGATERLDTSAGSLSGEENSGDVCLSDDGRFAAFVSSAEDLVANDTNDARDVFVRDRNAGTVERISVSSAEVGANGDSFQPALSANGRFAVFYSNATNLVAGDTNGGYDLFLRDRQAGITERINVTSDEEQAASSGSPSRGSSVSDNGRFIAFDWTGDDLLPNDTNLAADGILRDRQLGTTERISTPAGGGQANGPSFSVSLSGDGRFVAFVSGAGNLVSGDTNAVNDVFLVGLSGEVQQGADLSVSQVDSPDPVPLTKRVTYTITTRNNGPDAATGVLLEVTPPQGAANVKSQPRPSGRRGQTLLFELGNLAANATREVEVSAIARAAGLLTNVATVQGEQADLSVSNNRSEETTEAAGPKLQTLTLPRLSGDPPTIALPARKAIQVEAAVTLTARPKGTAKVPITLTGPAPARSGTARLVRKQSGSVFFDFGPTDPTGEYTFTANFGGVERRALLNVSPAPPLVLSGLYAEPKQVRRGETVTLTAILNRETPQTLEVPVSVFIEKTPVQIAPRIKIRKNRNQAKEDVRIPSTVGVGTYFFVAEIGGVTKTADVAVIP